MPAFKVFPKAYIAFALCFAFAGGAAFAKDTEVGFVSRDGSRLAGTLSIPDDVPAPVPAVFFVHDSGALDRDEQIGPNTIFKSIADALTGAGFAVLRYDKRAVGSSTSATPPARVVRENFIDDEAAALAFLRKQRGIDASNVFALGHGEGAELVSALALTGAPLRGLVVLAPQAQPYGVIIGRQLSAHPEAQSFVNALRASAWYKSAENIDPLREIARLQLPLLIVQGSADAQTVAADLPRVKLAAQEANKDVTVLLLDGDNHLFQHLLPGDSSTGREYFELHAVDARATVAIAQWLRSHVR